MRFLGWVPYQGLGTPLFLPALRHGNLIGHAPGGTGPASLFRARVERIVPSNPESFFERARGCFSRSSQPRDERAVAAVGGRDVASRTHGMT
jgi:hypothetical protein